MLTQHMDTSTCIEEEREGERGKEKERKGRGEEEGEEGGEEEVSEVSPYVKHSGHYPSPHPCSSIF